jgi:hypothetical protein
MPFYDWRLAAAYDRARDLEASGFAWEYLRRNPDYHRDHRALAPSITDPVLIAAFRERWGLCFCG